MLERRAILRFADSLHAEAALLHHALAAHRDVGVELPVERLGERVLFAIRLTIPEPIEVANLVRAVVRAVARADAAVVDLDVQPVGRVVRGVHRTDRLARRVAAVLTEHRYEARLEILAELSVQVAFEVALQTDPAHLAAARDVEARLLIGEDGRVLPECTDRRHVVLGVARRDARRTAGASREIDRHRPTTLRHSTNVVRLVYT